MSTNLSKIKRDKMLETISSIKENIEDEVKEKIQDAMDTCPTGAIVEEKENQAE